MHACVSERVCVHVHLCNACEGESTSSHFCMCALVSVSRYRSSFYFSQHAAGLGRLSGILIVLLHVAELHECGGRRKQPGAMWEMRGSHSFRAPGIYSAEMEAEPRWLVGGWGVPET